MTQRVYWSAISDPAKWEPTEDILDSGAVEPRAVDFFIVPPDIGVAVVQKHVALAGVADIDAFELTQASPAAWKFERINRARRPS